jgi:hypothetical protein
MSLDTVNSNVAITADLHRMEAQSTLQSRDTTHLVKKNDWITDVCCVKLTTIIITSIMILPFAICDVYFGSLYNTCLSQSQTDHNLTITVKSYLLVSGIIEFIGWGMVTVTIIVFVSDVTDTDSVEVFSGCVKHFTNAFGFAWLILGCVLFWAYTDISKCTTAIHDYMFARLILGILGIFGRTVSSQNETARRI